MMIEPGHLGDRVTVMETAIAFLADRQKEVQELTQATERLAQATMSVEEALRTVGELRHRQDQISKNVTKVSNRIPSRKKVALLVASMVALVAVAIYGLHDRSSIHHELRHLETCQSHPRAAVCLPHTIPGG